MRHGQWPSSPRSLPTAVATCKATASTSATKKRPIFGTATTYRPSKFCGAVLLCLGCDAVLLCLGCDAVLLLCLGCDAVLLLGCVAVRLKVCMRCP